MLTRLRARAIDGATNLVRLIDARRERDELRAELDRERERTAVARDRLRAARSSEFRAVNGRIVAKAAAAKWEDEVQRLRKALDLNQRSRESSNAQDEALRRDLSVLLTGDHPPLTPQDVVGRVQAVIDERDAARAERDARIPTDIDGAQAWAAKRGVLVQGGRRDTDWHCVVMSGEVVQRTNNRADAVHIAVWHSLHGMWRSDA